MTTDLHGKVAVVLGARREASLKKLADVAANSAGGSVHGLVADMTDELLNTALQLNFHGQVHFVKHAAAVRRQSARPFPYLREISGANEAWEARQGNDHGATK